MSLQEFNTLLEMFVEELASGNPDFKKEFDQYRSVIQGIKSSALREELRDIMDSEKPEDSDGV